MLFFYYIRSTDNLLNSFFCMKKFLLITIALFGVTLSMTSCFSTRILYGDVKPNEPLVQVNKEWNHYLIGGLVPVGKNKLEASEYVNNAENFVVKTNQSFINMLVAGITCGIYAPSQTKFYLPLRDLQDLPVDGKLKSDE